MVLLLVDLCNLCMEKLLFDADTMMLVSSLQSIICNAEYGNISRNVLLVNSSADHLKVGDFGLSKLIRVQNSHDVYKMTGETGSCEWSCLPPFIHWCFYQWCYTGILSDIFPYDQPIDRYMAPEVFKHRKYDKKVDVFSFAMILYEVMSIQLTSSGMR